MPTSTTSKRQPNIIVFFTDQQRWDSTGVHGNPLDLTPNFDQMARQGTHIWNAFTPQPVCGPARSCLQSGQYATTTGCFKNYIPLPEETRTIAHHLAEAGYHTGYVGKWHLGEPGVKGPVSPARRGGYDYWLASNALEWTSDAYQTTLYNNEGQAVPLPGYRVDALTDAAIRYVDAHQEEPFFLFLSFLEPHHQNHRDDYPAPVNYAERYTGRWTPPDLQALVGSAPQHLGGYWGMVKRLDEALGRLLDALRSLDLLDETIVVFTSDHGCHFKTRNAEYKRSCHESSIRVPLAITGPSFRGGGQMHQLVSLLDLPPTLLDAAGLPVPEAMQGQSLMPWVRRQSNSLEWPEEVLIQISESHVGRAIRTARWKYGVVAPDADPLTQGSSQRYQDAFLYDLQADPYELNNLIHAKSHQPIVEQMRALLKRRMTEAGEAEPILVA